MKNQDKFTRPQEGETIKDGQRSEQEANMP